MSAAYVALLRGVNVGGANKLPMRDLAEIVAAQGGTDVRTFIQSGNVAFNAPSDTALKMGSGITEGVRARFGFSPPVLLRERSEWNRVLAVNPFLQQGLPIEHLSVVFLADELEQAVEQRLSEANWDPDAISIQGREVFLYLPNGVTSSRLTQSNFYSKLGTCSARNWKTVCKLAEMIAAL